VLHAVNATDLRAALVAARQVIQHLKQAAEGNGATAVALHALPGLHIVAQLFTLVKCF
jgi:hypothetical protein